MNTHSPLVMTMSDIAAVAKVQRPVVSVWRSRSATTDRPFPAPISHRGDQQLFDAAEIGQWLNDSQYGNNPNAAADAAAHSVTLNSLSERDAAATTTAGRTTDNTAQQTFDAVTALLALRHQLGVPLAARRTEPNFTATLLDAADENDPDDESLFSELEAASDDLGSLAAYVDALVESAYGEAPAFERVLADRAKRAGETEASTTLSHTALTLMAEIAAALNDRDGSPPVFVDAAGSASDILLALSRIERLTSEVTVLTATDPSAPSRLLRRRMLTHGIHRLGLSADARGDITVTGPAVHVAQFPSANRPVMTTIEILDAIDRLVMSMTAHHTAVLLAPASVLTDALAPGTADDQRSEILRSRRLRAIVRLPAGLLAHKPQQAQALWVFAAADQEVPLADLVTLVADLTETLLDATVIQDLVNDLVASLGNEVTVRSHAFRFARLVPTRVLLANRASLVAAVHGPTLRDRGNPSGAELALRAGELVFSLADPDELGNGGDLGNGPGLDHIAISAIGGVTNPGDSVLSSTATIEQLLRRRHFAYIPGNRIDPDIVLGSGSGSSSASGLRIIGPGDVLSGSPSTRRIDSLRFFAEHPTGRLTEPGDIVFCTSPRPAAKVDTEGTSVVVFPARILRINSSSPNGLLAEIIAADINAQQETSRRWRHWLLRRVRPAEGPALAQAIAAIRSEQAIARGRLTQLDELAALLIAGTTAGTLTLTTPSPLSAPESLAPPKGTP